MILFLNQFLLGNESFLYNYLGAHLIKDEKGQVTHTRFRTYAPNAKEVRLISEMNNYEGWKHVLTKVHHHGVYEITIPQNLEWATYKYEIHLRVVAFYIKLIHLVILAR